jgi:hypothetical protein
MLDWTEAKKYVQGQGLPVFYVLDFDVSFLVLQST